MLFWGEEGGVEFQVLFVKNCHLKVMKSWPQVPVWAQRSWSVLWTKEECVAKASNISWANFLLIVRVKDPKVILKLCFVFSVDYILKKKAEKDCWAQTASRGHDFTTFKCQFLTNRTRNYPWQPEEGWLIIYLMFLPPLWIRLKKKAFKSENYALFFQWTMFWRMKQRKSGSTSNGPQSHFHRGNICVLKKNNSWKLFNNQCSPVVSPLLQPFCLGPKVFPLFYTCKKMTNMGTRAVVS